MEIKLRKNKQLAPLAAATLMTCATGLAQAQSNVTLYGLTDAGVTYLNNVGGLSRTQLDSGIGTTSRFGFRGSEDLGDGLAAIFTLESGLNIDTGTTKTPFWTRGSFVGLRSKAMGTLTVGRQYDFLYTTLPPDSVPFIQGGLAAGYQGFGNTRPGPPPAIDIHFGGQLYDNSAKWEHTIGAFSGGVMYGLGSENRNDKMAAAFLKYADANFQLGAAWVKDNFTTAVFANEVVAVKGFYRIGSFKLMANYAQGKETVFAGSKARIKPLELAVDYNITPAARIGGGYGWARATNRAGVDATLTQPFIGAHYTLSKRTELYAMAARNHSSNAAAIPASVNAPGGASGPSSTDSQSAFRTGITHRF